MTTKGFAWNARKYGGGDTVGISNHAQDQLGDMVFFKLAIAGPGELSALKDETAYRTFLEALD